MPDPSILVVDDDAEIRSLVQDFLERHHMSVDTAASASEARSLLARSTPDLIVLDLMMPGEDGTTFCRSLRQTSDIPILMLSALSDDIDRILGLETGADDYLAKPFNPRELLARIRSILKRMQPSLSNSQPFGEKPIYVFDRFRLDPNSRSLESDGGSIDLTSGEFTLLLILLEHAPRILSRTQLLEYSRGISASAFDRSIDTHISRLRNKLEEDPKKPLFIKTVRNLGYAFAAKLDLVKS